MPVFARKATGLAHSDEVTVCAQRVHKLVPAPRMHARCGHRRLVQCLTSTVPDVAHPQSRFCWAQQETAHIHRWHTSPIAAASASLSSTLERTAATMRLMNRSWCWSEMLRPILRPAHSAQEGKGRGDFIFSAKQDSCRNLGQRDYFKTRSPKQIPLGVGSLPGRVRTDPGGGF